MLWVQQKGNLSLFSTNTDGCCFEWGLVLLKHDKVRDDMPLVTKVWRSRNASAVPFFSQDKLLFMYQLPIKGETLSGHAFSLFVFPCVDAKIEKWENEQNFHTDHTEEGVSVITAWSTPLSVSCGYSKEPSHYCKEAKGWMCYNWKRKLQKIYC